MNLKELEQSGRIIYSCVSGSRAYGTNMPDSDIDIRGVFFNTREELLSLNEPDNQISDDKNDTTYYSLKRFFELASVTSPNIIELLWTPEDCIKMIAPAMQTIIDNRSLFISKKAYHTFSGYAHSQIKRAKGRNKWVNNPKPKDPPSKMDFCWVIPAMPDINRMPMRPIRLADSGFDLTRMNAAKMEHMESTYRLYDYGNSAKAKGVFRGKQGHLEVESIPKEDEWNHFVGLLIFNLTAYDAAYRDWKNYHDWLKNRNEARYRTMEAGEIDYDCYLDTETEFLTDSGWLPYDEITDERLATVRPLDNSFEFQEFTDRFSSQYSGDIYTFENSYTRFSVTPNHNLYVSDGRRGPKNGFSTRYDRESSNWHLETVDDYWTGRRSYKHVLTCCESFADKDVDVSDDFIRLLGLYLSDGSIAYSRKGSPAYVYISQIEDGKACKVMDKVTEFDVATSKHFRKGRNELTYIIKNKKLAVQFSDFGCYSEDKRMPFDMAMSFSRRQANLLLDAMLSGDGHKHAKGHFVYYTCSERLADDLFALLVKNGIPCQVYGPYQYDDENKPLYHVFISGFRKGNPTMMISKTPPKNGGYAGWAKQKVLDERIVCFTVPNGVLITRNKGKVAIQGNSKNIMHCMRLLWSGENILKHGEPIVRFEGKDRQFLLDVRNGKFDYDEIMAIVEEKKIELDELRETSTIPNKVNIKKIDELYQSVMGDFFV